MMRVAAAFAVVLALHAGEKKSAEKELKCPKEVYRRLDKAVGEACKSKPLRCEEWHTCEELRERWQRRADCITARQQLMVTCFDGGDPGHRSEVDRQKVGLENCTFLLLQKKCESSGLHKRPVVIFQVVPCSKPCEDEGSAEVETQQKRSPPPHRGGVPVGPVPGR